MKYYAIYNIATEEARGFASDDESQIECNVGKDEVAVEIDADLFYSIDRYKMHKGEFILKPIVVNQYAQRENSVSKIAVTTTFGKTFDGDEKSQDRMLRAINIAVIAGQTETEWKLADNTIVMVTLDELKEALTLAGQEMSRIWLEIK